MVRKYFGTDGIRGRANGSITPEVALKVGRGDILIGPDNGLLIEAAELLGGIVEARVLENRALWLPVVSSSFHASR